MTEEKVYFQSDVKLCGTLVLPDQNKSNKRAVLLCHGITVDKEEGGVFTQLAKRLGEEGCTVLRFDFRGHGESEGRQEDMTVMGEIQDITAAVSYLTNLGFSQIILLGASFGGGSTTIYTAEHTDISLLLLWNPGIDYEHIFFKPSLRTRKWVTNLFTGDSALMLKEKGYVLLGSRKFRMGKNLISEMKKVKPFEALKKIECPVVFFHGTKDGKVDYMDSVTYSQLVKGEAQVLLYKDFGHGFHEERERQRVISDTLFAIQQYSSGND